MSLCLDSQRVHVRVRSVFGLSGTGGGFFRHSGTDRVFERLQTERYEISVNLLPSLIQTNGTFPTFLFFLLS
jgi:hypothetical protein